MTAAQVKASDPGASVWVAASAGTGKTKVLTDRVLRLLLQGAVPAKILCLTFTKAAAAEMQNRIQAELAGWVGLPEKALVQRLHGLTGDTPTQQVLDKARRLFLEVLDVPEGLKIQTIHAFCQMLMRRFPLEAGVAPHFKVVDEYTAKELLHEARMQLFSRLGQNEDKELEEAVKGLVWRVHEQGFTELLQELANRHATLAPFLAAHTPEGRTALIYKYMGVERSDSESSMIARACQGTDTSHLSRAAETLLQGGKQDKERGEVLAAWLAQEQEGRVAVFNRYSGVYVTANGQPRKRMASKAAVDSYPEIETILQTEQERIVAVLDKVKSVRVAELTVRLLKVAAPVIEHYQLLKEKHAYLDYSDLVVKASQLLQRPEVAPWVLYKLDGGLEHILVDEAQDTSLAQWQVVQALCAEFFSGQGSDSEKSVFVVGDGKQSIYSFQGADPAVFGNMQTLFADRIRAAAKIFHCVSLDISFRSAAPVLAVVDAVFKDPTLRDCVSLGEGEVKHAVHRLGHAGKVEIWPLAKAPEKPERQPWALPDTQKQQQDVRKELAVQIAGTIKHWLNAQKILPSKGRAVAPGDILVLVRKRSVFVDYLVNALKERAIPVAGADRMVLTEHLAVMDMVALGHFLLLPEDDLNLAVVLKSPLVGLSEEGLFTLAYGRGETSLWQRLQEQAEQDATDGLYAPIYRYLCDLLQKVETCAPFELFSYILDSSDGRKNIASRLGMQANDPLDEFLSLALQYEESHVASLQEFLHWLEKGKSEVKRDMSAAADEVRVMTVHGAKGLQAPVVFLPDTVQMPEAGGRSPRIYWPDDVPGMFLWPGKADNEGSVCQRLREQNRQAAYREYIRLLYVALTRAEDELYITGYEGKVTAPEGCWYHLVKEAAKPIMHQQGENYVLSCIQEQPVTADRSAEKGNEGLQLSDLPSFLFEDAVAGQISGDIVSPSTMGEEASSNAGPGQAIAASQAVALLKGEVTHSLLQHLAGKNRELTQHLAQTYLQRYYKQLDTATREEILRQVATVLHHPDFAEIFGAQSKAEVPIIGEIDGKTISGQVDRLVVGAESVLVVDFKTNHSPPHDLDHVPPTYIAQMQAYRLLLQGVYPDKRVECTLLWTEDARLMILPEALLALPL